MPDLSVQPPLYHGLAVHQYQAADDRRLTELLAGGEGVAGPGAFKVTATSPESMAVRVAPGRAIVKGDNVARQGSYVLEETTTLTVPIAANSSGQPRIDLVVLRDYDAAADGGAQASDRGTVEVVQGTPAASPAPPATPPSAIVLARVTVASGAATITSANIVDRRPPLPGRRIVGGMTGSGPIVVPANSNAALTFDDLGRDPWGICDLTNNMLRLLPQGPAGVWLVDVWLDTDGAGVLDLQFETNGPANIDAATIGSVGRNLVPVNAAGVVNTALRSSILLVTTGDPPDAGGGTGTVDFAVFNWSASPVSVNSRGVAAVYLGPE